MEEKSGLGDLGVSCPAVPTWGRAQDWRSVNGVEGMNEVCEPGNKEGLSRGWEALGRARWDLAGKDRQLKSEWAEEMRAKGCLSSRPLRATKVGPPAFHR